MSERGLAIMWVQREVKVMRCNLTRCAWRGQVVDGIIYSELKRPITWDEVGYCSDAEVMEED